MNLKHLVSRKAVDKICRINERFLFPQLSSYRCLSTIRVPLSSNGLMGDCSLIKGYRKVDQNFMCFVRYIHSTRETKAVSLNVESKDDAEEDGNLNEFLSRFAWLMRKKICEAYPECDKPTVDGMLLVIVRKVVAEMEKGGLQHIGGGGAVSTPSEEFSEDLWKTVWDVSYSVLDDMEKERKKERMKGFLQSEDVQKMTRFAGEIGIRGDMLRELKFKWAREKMEDSEFYEGLKQIREDILAQEKEDNAEAQGEQGDVVGEEPKEVGLPKRHGKIKYKIYGLDLSDSKWAEVADKINESGEVLWPQEPKQITGKCKLVTERILSLKDEDPSPVLAEWMELLQPSRIDWMNLLDRLKEKNPQIYFKVAELLLDETSFKANISDYSKLIENYAKNNLVEDVDRMLKKMNDNGIVPDVLVTLILLHMHSKAGNLQQAEEAFESLKSQGFQPDLKVYSAMIMAYVKAGKPASGEALMREMDAGNIKPSMEIFLALLQAFAEQGDVQGTGRISTTMQFAGFQPTLESGSIILQAYAHRGDPDTARNYFDDLINLGHKPDDRCTANMIAAYESKNYLDKALGLLLALEKDGFQPGIATYTVLVDWFAKMGLVEEVEQLLSKIAQLGEPVPLKLQVSLCDMYARARVEKKTLKALGVLQTKADQLRLDEFDRIFHGLIAGRFVKDAARIVKLMESRGYNTNNQKVTLQTYESLHK